MKPGRPPQFLRRAMYGLGGCVFGLLMAAAASATSIDPPSESDLLRFSRNELEVGSSYTDAQILASFSAKHYGVDWRDWIGVLLAEREAVDAFLSGRFDEGIEHANIAAQEFALSQIVSAAPVESFGAATHLLGVSNAFVQLSADVEAYRRQHVLYLQARQYNSARMIASLEPFELLDGITITKEGNGWLFQRTGYASPFPTSMEPEEFWPLAEDAAQLAARSRASIEDDYAALGFAFERSIVPEPSGTALLGGSMLALAAARRRPAHGSAT